MATFAAAFREIVIPDLRKACVVQGMYLSAGLATWPEAFGEVLKLATDRGALHLPSSDWDGLTDWIAAELTRDVARSDQLTTEWEALTPAHQWQAMARRRLARGA